MIEWMRRYNADPRHTKKVKFYGFDIHAAPRAARVTLAYLRKVDPEQAAAEKSLALIANLLTDPAFETSPAEKKEEMAAAIVAALKRLDERREEFV